MDHTLDNLISTLQLIDSQLINNINLSQEDIDILLLIIYNEIIINNNTSPVILSYITIILHNYIKLKNSNTNISNLIDDLIHPGISAII